MTKLRPCPFCGGKAQTERVRPDVVNIECEGCGVVLFGGGDSANEMVAKWNRRIGDAMSFADRTGRLARVQGKSACLDLGNGVECWCPIDELEDLDDDRGGLSCSC